MAERNMDMKKCPMPVQDPDVRNKNFDEVALGYTYDMAVNEARRCLNCPKKPCQSACPVQIDIPAFIERVANEDMDGAFEILSKSTSLPAVCGRVCPQENVSVVSKVKQLVSDVWSVLWQITTENIAQIHRKCRSRMVIKWL